MGGRPTDFSYTDELVEAASRENIVLLPIALGTPRWAARNPGREGSAPEGTEAYAEYMEALIGRYGPDGSFWSENEDVPKRPLRDWQLWNEPDRPKYWVEQPYARDYVRLARVARGAIKEADPGARVVMAGFAERSWVQLDAVYRAGAKGVFDVAAIHPYTLRDPERRAHHPLRPPRAAPGRRRRPPAVADRGHVVVGAQGGCAPVPVRDHAA